MFPKSNKPEQLTQKFVLTLSAKTPMTIKAENVEDLQRSVELQAQHLAELPNDLELEAIQVSIEIPKQ